MKGAFKKRARAVFLWGGAGLLIGLAALLAVFPEPARTQEEVASHIARYRERVRTGYYEGYEVKPRELTSYDLMRNGIYEGNEVIPLKRARDQVRAPGIMPSAILLSPTAAEVRIRSRLPDAHAGIKFYEQSTCIECHPRQARSVHTDRGGINCRQCHGPEPIPAINHYYSLMNPIRRHAYVCAKCHEGANDLYAMYVVHEPPAGALTTLESFPLLFYTSWGMLLLLVGTLAFFIPHSLMVGFRELFEKKKAHVKKIPTIYIKRFSKFQRVFHLFLMLTFLIQASTGLSRMFIITGWGEKLSNFFGGYETAYLIHCTGGVLMMLGFAVHIIILMTKIDRRNLIKSLIGPDSMVPTFQDAKHLWQRIRWFFGLGPPPKLDRWAYWEKFDYWAVFWGIPLLGGTGLMLMFPFLTSQILPGWTLNIAALLHRAEALLAISYVFIVHFFIGHLRPLSFPMSEAMFSGSVPLEEAREEKQAWVERLTKEGKIELAGVNPPARWFRTLYFIFGYTALGFGLYILINGIYYSRYIRLH